MMLTNPNESQEVYLKDMENSDVKQDIIGTPSS